MKSGLKFAIGAAALALAAVPTAAQPATVKVGVGAQVSDTAGNPVGTIEQVNGDLAVLNTGANKVSLPLSSFGAGEKGPILGMTRAQVDAAAAGAAASSQAEAIALVTTGAQVTDTSGASVGTIESVEGDFATVATANSKVKLPLSAFGKGDNGPVIAMTAAELDAAAAKAGGSASQSN